MATTLTRKWTAAGIGVAVGLAGLLATGAALHAQADRGRGFGGPAFGSPGGPGIAGAFATPGALMRSLRALDISDAQREQIRAVFEQYRPQVEALGPQIRDGGRALQEAVTAEVFDEVTIRDRSTALATVQADLAVLGAQMHSAVFALLTPEQRQKAAELKAEREQRMEQRRQRMDERRRGR